MGIISLFGKKKDYEPAEIYLRLRKQIFSLTEDQLHSLLDPSSPLMAVLMESGYEEAVVTLVAVADGTVSLYFSNGGGMIGLGEDDLVRKASIDFLWFAGGSSPKPSRPGNTRFRRKALQPFIF